MITRQEVVGLHEIPKELEGNLETLLERVNKFRQLYGEPMIVTSGYRTRQHNEMIGGSKDSHHMLCMACDFYDPSGKLKAYIKENPDILETCDLYQEDPEKTKMWVHLDTFPRKNRVFKI